MDIRNPTGITRSPEELAESFRSSYWDQATGYGLQYYVAGRFAVAGRLMPVSASLLHHAVELLLKAALSRGDSAEMIRAYGSRKCYGHSLEKLMAEFKRRHPTLVGDDVDEVIKTLDQFEDIRYPEDLIENGAMIAISMYNVDNPVVASGGFDLGRLCSLALPKIDRLVHMLCTASGINPEFCRARVSGEHAALYYQFMNGAPFIDFGKSP